MPSLANTQRPSLPFLASPLGLKELLVGFVFFATILFTAYSILFLEPFHGFAAIVGCGLFFISFLNMGAGLALFFLCILFSPEITIQGRLLGTIRPITVRFEDFLAVVFVLGWIARLAILREYKIFAHTRLNKPISLFLIVCVLATVRGVSIGYVYPATGLFFNLKYAQYFLVFFLVANYVRSYEQLTKLLFVAMAVLGLFCAYSIYQIPSVAAWQYRIVAPFAHQAESTSIGGILGFAAAVLLAMLIYVKQTRYRFWLAVGFVGVFFPFLYTLSRTSYIAFFFMVLFVAIYSRSKALFFALVILVFLSPIVLPQTVFDRIAYTWRDAREMGVDPSTQERILVLHKFWVTLTCSPVIALMGVGVSAHDIVDNQYVRIMVETGLIGLILFLWILLIIYKTSYRIFKNTKIAWVKGFSVGYIAGLFGFMVHCFGAITFTIIRTMEMFWFLTGIVFVYASIMDKAEPKILQERPHLALFPVPR